MEKHVFIVKNICDNVKIFSEEFNMTGTSKICNQPSATEV